MLYKDVNSVRPIVIMEVPKSNIPKLPDMIMSGDHPSFNKHPSFVKTELNVKEDSEDSRQFADDHRRPASFLRVSPSSSRSLRAASEHALQLIEARRRLRSIDRAGPKADLDTLTGNRALVQGPVAFAAAVGSFRWPPYLLLVWVLVLVITHAIHCSVAVLEKTLPNIKKLCTYFHNWAEDLWLVSAEYNHRVFPICLALLTGIFYTLYYGLYVIYSIVMWSIEPLCPDILLDEKANCDCELTEAKVTNYEEVMNGSTNCTDGK